MCQMNKHRYFTKWYAENELHFHQAQFNTEEIAYDAFLFGIVVSTEIARRKKAEALPMRCNICGHFIAYKDFDEGGSAVRILDTPDTEFTSECYITLCPKHAIRYQSI